MRLAVIQMLKHPAVLIALAAAAAVVLFLILRGTRRGGNT